MVLSGIFLGQFSVGRGYAVGLWCNKTGTVVGIHFVEMFLLVVTLFFVYPAPPIHPPIHRPLSAHVPSGASLRHSTIYAGILYHMSFQHASSLLRCSVYVCVFFISFNLVRLALVVLFPARHVDVSFAYIYEYFAMGWVSLSHTHQVLLCVTA